jgi:membrane protein implicated in regulation of membrane protease activity
LGFLLNCLSILAEPSLLGVALLLAWLPTLLFPGIEGLTLSGLVVAVSLWLNHRVERSASSQPIRVGAEAMVGRRGVVVERLAPLGVVSCDGELWRAVELSGREVAPGQQVEVVRLRGLLLEVRAVVRE